MADSIGNIYGNALFEVCCEENCLDEVYGELGSIRNIIFSQGQEEYVELLASPLVTENEKRATLEKVFMGRIQPVTLNFLCLVSEKGRIRFLPEICAKFKELYEKHNNIIEVTAVTAMPLSERLRDKLVAKLEAVSGAKIVLVEKVDKSLMGGIVQRYSDTEIDGSVRTKLDNIKAQIDGVIA